MADRNEGQDSSNIEIFECREPHLEATQDLELLAQEIAEAAVEDERKSSTPSPSPPQTLPSECETATKEDSSEEEDDDEEEEDDDEEEEEDDDDEEMEGLDKCEDDLTHLEEETTENVRSSSPVDEASWVLVDADDEGRRAEFPEQKFSVYRKFLARGDLRQKLIDLGFLSDATAQASGGDGQKDQSLQNVMSCSESMVICDLPEEGDAEEDSVNQVFSKDSPEGPGMPSWRGSITGAMVEVEMERQGGLMVAAVTVWHRDLLSALNSLRSLVSSAGLVSYADVDVTSLLARAA